MNAVRAAVAFALFVSVTCDDTTFCEKSPFEDCKPRGIPHLAFPESEEEFKEFCSTILSTTSCLLDYSKRCPDEEYDNSWEIKRYEKTLSIIPILCDEEGDLYKGIVEHVSCFKNTLEDNNILCRNLTNELRDSIGNEDTREVYHIKFVCLKNILHTACLIPRIGESCGLKAEEIFVDVFDTIKGELRGCPEHFMQEVSEMIQVLEMEEVMKMKAQKVLELLQLREPVEYEYYF